MRQLLRVLMCGGAIAWAAPDLRADPIWVNDVFGVLHSVDTETGTPTAVGTLRNAGGTLLNSMFDIAENSEGNLFGVWGVSSNLFSIDTTNALASPIGFTGTTGLTGLAFDASDNLYATRTDRGGLWTIDTSTGEAQFVGLVSDGAVEYFVEDIAFDCNGILYGVGTSGSPIVRLVMIDPATAHATLIGVMNFHLVTGLAFDGDNNLFGAARTGLLISIDTTTGLATLVSQNDVFAHGAASNPFRQGCGTDSNPPVVVPPPDITVEATGPLTPVDLGTATATDPEDGPLTATPDTIGPFPLGTTVVTWSATDAAGNTATATQLVTVVDTTPPSVVAPPDVTVFATGALTEADLQPALASAFDLVDGALTPAPDTMGPFLPGTALVTWSATDSSGNTGFAVQRVEVRFDCTGFEPPVDSPPAVNRAQAGQTIPIKWRCFLGGDFLRDTSIVASLRFFEVTCDDTSGLDGELIPGTAGESGLRYDGSQERFIFNWQTSKDMAGRCFVFEVGLTDDTVRTASFMFR